MTEDIRKVGNGKCDGGDIDTIDCGFDAGDCLAFNLAYPMCDVTFDAYKVGDGKCNREDKFFTPQCLYDGGDCCELLSKGFDVDLVGNGFCNGGVYSYACDNDEGDCTRVACDLKLAETGKSTYSVVVKDVNGDDFPDIVIGNYGESNQLLLNVL